MRVKTNTITYEGEEGQNRDNRKCKILKRKFPETGKIIIWNISRIEQCSLRFLYREWTTGEIPEAGRMVRGLL